MSKFGGFLTVEADSAYNTLLYNLVYLLQFRLRKFYQGDESVNEGNFKKVLWKTFQKMNKMESRKGRPPKFSGAVGDLIEVLFGKHEIDRLE